MKDEAASNDTMAKTRRYFVVIGILIAIALLAGWLFVRLTAPAAKLSLGRCEFQLFVTGADMEMPISYRNFECQIIVEGEVVVPKIVFAMSETNFNSLTFDLISSPDRQVVALIERSDPDVVLAIYALDTRESYPNASMSETLLEGISLRKRLIARLGSNFTPIDMLNRRHTKL